MTIKLIEQIGNNADNFMNKYYYPKKGNTTKYAKLRSTQNGVVSDFDLNDKQWFHYDKDKLSASSFSVSRSQIKPYYDDYHHVSNGTESPISLSLQIINNSNQIYSNNLDEKKVDYLTMVVDEDENELRNDFLNCMAMSIKLGQRRLTRNYSNLLVLNKLSL